ncbi:MAG TPA: TerC family protein [Chthoniobacteraceae bacterium]|jgi:tellurite resistance protein TerC|nr:TerC family protein [Chthoniobacteraceae bacterium]
MPEPIWWAAFLGFVFVLLALDLGVFHRKAHEVHVREALIWSSVWISLALTFNAGIYFGWIGGYAPELRSSAAAEFLTGYLVEKSLSVDNVFVFALIFTYFHIPAKFQHRILFWGIIGALIMRAIMIFAGIALIQRFHAIIYVFGAIVIFSGIKMWASGTPKVDPEHNRVLRLVRRFFPMTPNLEGQKFFVRTDAGLSITPLFAVLVFIEWSDVVFAVDSIPAILAISQDPFVVFTSNVMAMLGLRSLYFALAGIMQKFHLLHYGLSALLIFIGLKMVLSDVIKVPIAVSLSVIALILIVSVTASMMFPKAAEPEHQPHSN